MENTLQQLSTADAQRVAYEKWLALYKAWLKFRNETLPEVI